MLLAGGATVARGQSALDGFDPNANNQVRVVVVQPDGKILIGGDFTSLSPNGGAPVVRNHIARLNPDGTLDTVFDPNANGAVRAIALQTDGKILVGGAFSGASSIGGQTRNFIARLDATTGLADSFDPNADIQVSSLAVQADGKVLAGGDFTSIGGQMRNRMARLDPVTGLADSFDPSASSSVVSIVVQVDGRILVGGLFSVIGGQTRNGIARLDSATGLPDSFNPNANDRVLSIALQADGKILVIGWFSGTNSIGGQTRNYIARLDPTTGLADSFNPNPSSNILALAVQADGKVLVGGLFSGANSIGGQTRNRVARLDPTTGLADSFNPNVSADVNALAVQADGKVLVGGSFSGGSSVAGQTRNNIARLETDGLLDQTLDPGIVGDQVYATAVQPDGKILIGGVFTTVLGVARNNIARLNTDGTLDTFFDPNANGRVYAIAVQPDGKILVGGVFSGASSIGGQTRNFIARLDATTGLADSFDPNASGNVFTIALQADGQILVGGQFTSIGNQLRLNIARLDGATGLADSFDPEASGFMGASRVTSIAVQPDGRILVAGLFSDLGGQPHGNIGRLHADGANDGFFPGTNGAINSMVEQPDGKVLVGGQFTIIQGQARNYIGRIDYTTFMADSFDPGSSSVVVSIALQADGKVLANGFFPIMGGAGYTRIARLDATNGVAADSFDPNPDNGVSSIAVRADGKILAGGIFGNMGGQARNLFARLSNDTAALQSLAVTQGAITWTRGGSSPQFERVTFEDSTDNVTYNSLGNGTPSGNNWSLTGLSLPTGQNIYVRARGYYRSGYQNGSESIAESVRNAFIVAPLQLTTAVSRKTHGGAGDFDIPLPLSGEPGVECRSSGGNHTLVFTTSNNLVSGNASLTSGTGSVSGSPSFSGNTMTVSLTGVTDVQKITVTLSNVTDSFAQVLPDTAVSVNMLIGDVNGNKTVNSTDVSQTKLQSGQPVTAANFREDIIPNGQINGSDVSQAKLRVGSGVP